MFAWICCRLRKPTGTSRMRLAFRPSLNSALVPALLLMAVAGWSSRAAERTAADACPAASAVLQRFILSQERASGWPLETIEIGASLPKLKKAGWLRAIRRTFPAEKPHYDVLEIAGDRTVKNQVIARYLSATERATDLPVSSVAITSANYEIHYAGRVPVADRPAYAFRITPRK